MEENKNLKQENIHEKGFELYNKIKVGKKTLTDAIADLENIKCGTYERYGRPEFVRKSEILRALAENDGEKIRAISNYFYRTNGIYQKVCNYIATLYRYDWYVVPEIYKDVEELNTEKIINEFSKVLNYLDNTYITKLCGELALKVILNGCYYGYIIKTKTGLSIQELPIKYCRVRYFVGNKPAVEFNMSYFDAKFPDPKYRMKVLKLFPKEFAEGYVLYKQGKLEPEYIGSDFIAGGWYLLDPDSTIRFTLSPSGAGLPLFINAIPSLLDLDEMQGINRRKQLQNLAKIIVQKLPMDKNGDLIFDVDEAADIHENAVKMLSQIVGADVLTTFTDVDDIDLSDTSNVSDNSLENSERGVYNALGVTKNLFNSDGNLSTEKSIQTDAGAIRGLLLQFEVFFNEAIQHLNASPKKYKFKFYMLETTQYNYMELSKMYKEQVQIGYSKMLPQIAMGHSQSSILNAAYFENDILGLSNIMIPPLMSSVMNADTIAAVGKKGKTQDADAQKNVEGGQVGRPEKAESEKSDKTIANEESQK